MSNNTIDTIHPDQTQTRGYIAFAIEQWIDHVIADHISTIFPDYSYCVLEPGNLNINQSLIASDSADTLQHFNWACYHCHYLEQRITRAEQHLTTLENQQLQLWCTLFDNTPDTAQLCINFHRRLYHHSTAVRNEQQRRGPESRTSPFLFRSNHTPSSYNDRSGAPSPSTNRAESHDTASESAHSQATPSHTQSFSPSYSEFADFMANPPSSTSENFTP